MVHELREFCSSHTIVPILWQHADQGICSLKAAPPAKQEQARFVDSLDPDLADKGVRLHVEEAEDKLVQCTETAIGLMKAVLENVRSALLCYRHQP
jgi:hypothetical protein